MILPLRTTDRSHTPHSQHTAHKWDIWANNQAKRYAFTRSLPSFHFVLNDFHGKDSHQTSNDSLRGWASSNYIIICVFSGSFISTGEIVQINQNKIQKIIIIIIIDREAAQSMKSTNGKSKSFIFAFYGRKSRSNFDEKRNMVRKMIGIQFKSKPKDRWIKVWTRKVLWLDKLILLFHCHVYPDFAKKYISKSLT